MQHIFDPHQINRFAIIGIKANWPVIVLFVPFEGCTDTARTSIESCTAKCGVRFRIAVSARPPGRAKLAARLSGQTSRLVRTSDLRCCQGPSIDVGCTRCALASECIACFASRNRNSNGGWNRNPNRSRADPRQQPLSVDLHGFTGKVYVALGRPKRLAGGWIR